MAERNYQRLIGLTRKAGILDTISGQLEWDTCVTMPPAAIDIRANQNGVLAEVIHELSTKKEIGDLLLEINPEELSEEERVNFDEIKYDYESSLRTPPELLKELAETETGAQGAWEEAKKKSDYTIFMPWLGKIISLQKMIAEAESPGEDNYVTLMKDYEDGLSREEISAHLNTIKESIVPLILEVSRKKNPGKRILQKNISESKQEAFCRKIAEKLGYDFTKGRLDKSSHPFTAAYGRITTKYDEGWLEAIGSTIHEVGHSMYDHNLPLEHLGTPIGQHASLSVHESQSRLWENHIGKSREFWELMTPELNKAYGLKMTPRRMHRLSNIVEPGFIRTQADELTYTMHIVLRYEIESEMMTGGLKLEELPGIWNEKMEKYLGIKPRNDSEGVLQDIHWSCGLIGYFPTYAMGSMIATQLFDKMEEEMPVSSHIRNGEFNHIQEWLKDKIHRHGSRYKTKELIKLATGREPTPEPYIRYLTKKYTELYNL